MNLVGIDAHTHENGIANRNELGIVLLGKICQKWCVLIAVEV